MKHPTPCKRCTRALAAAFCTIFTLGLAQPAAALDLSWSGFATLGYARSADAPGRYLRWIDEPGSFNPRA